MARHGTADAVAPIGVTESAVIKARCDVVPFTLIGACPPSPRGMQSWLA